MLEAEGVRAAAEGGHEAPLRWLSGVATVRPMKQTGTQVVPTAPPVLDPLFEVIEETDEIAHLVCCRDVSWRRAWCGEENDQIVSRMDVICTMCLEVADQKNPGWRFRDPCECPIDGQPCPSDEELDAIIARRSL